MNFKGFEFNDNLKFRLNSLEALNRLPHAVIIESEDAAQRAALCDFICRWAVCSDKKNKPCGGCKNCINSQSHNHSDILYVKSKDTKTGIIKVADLREQVIKNAVVVPNDADVRVFVFEDADKRLQPITQNTFLKTLEEPPDNVLFILTCEKSKTLLPTILSRCTVFSMNGGNNTDIKINQSAINIATAIVSGSEYGLLKACYDLGDNKNSAIVLPVVAYIFRDALMYANGVQNFEVDEQTAKLLSGSLTKNKLMQLLDVISYSQAQLKQNVNFNLFATALCANFRRIAWQK